MARQLRTELASRRALCAEYEHVAEWWFPERGESAEPAKGVCARCLVRVECASWALDEGEHLPGIWGGLSGRDRRRLHAAGVTGELLLLTYGMGAAEIAWQQRWLDSLEVA